jgi:hypothetical protein
MNGVVTLGELVGRVKRLEIRCKRCDRHGRVRLTRLIEQHGADLDLPSLGTRLAADCPKANSIDFGERCFVVFPQLLE